MQEKGEQNRNEVYKKKKGYEKIEGRDIRQQKAEAKKKRKAFEMREMHILRKFIKITRFI